MIELDGSKGEGGGQIVRTALALSAYTGNAVRITKIRQGRENPGLKAQHLAGINAVSRLCNGSAEGAETGSTELVFHPQKIKGGKIDIDIGTAGSITLLLQSVLLPAFFAEKPTRLIITGGTDTEWSMPMDYFANVLAPHLRQWCEKLNVNILKRGYYPKGGGKVEIYIKPKKEKHFRPFSLTEQGELLMIKGVSHASSDLEEARVAERQASSAKTELSRFNATIEIRSEYSSTLSTGSGITLWAVFSKDPHEVEMDMPIMLGSDALGKKGIPAEAIGKEAAENLAKAIKSGAPVDKHLADNLVPFLAVAGGEMLVQEITSHTRTNVGVVNSFFGKVIEIDEEKRILRRAKQA